MSLPKVCASRRPATCRLAAIVTVAVMALSCASSGAFKRGLKAERADDYPKVYTSVKLVYTVRGRKLNRALIERAVSLSDEKYCSVHATLERAVPITSRFEIVPEA